MKFQYNGFDRSNQQRVSGEIDAVTKQEVGRLLEQQNIDVINISVQGNESKKGRIVKEHDLVLPLRELATLTSSGVSLIDAINALSQNNDNPRLSTGFLKIAQVIEGGGKFSDAVESSELPFPTYLAQLVKAGELSGQLTVALNNAALQMEYEQTIRSDIRSALTYPIVLIVSGIAAMLIIFFAVVPKFSHLLDGEKELPFLAFFVLSAGRLVNDSPFLVLGFIISIIALTVVIYRQQKVRHFVFNHLLNVPVIGPWLEEQDTARWAALAAAMLSAKVSLVAALHLAANASSFDVRQKRAETMVKDIEKGDSFGDALARARLVPPTSINLILVGDKTGQLADMLSSVANLHDNACKRKMKQVLTLMEPVAILIVGILIGVMILGIVLAITASTDIAI